jgi:hypothetical protein
MRWTVIDHTMDIGNKETRKEGRERERERERDRGDKSRKLEDGQISRSRRMFRSILSSTRM